MTVPVDPMRQLRRTRNWAVLWSWLALLVGVPVVAVYANAGMVGWWPTWAREGLLAAACALAMAQLIAVHLRRWTLAVVLLCVVAAPWVVASLMAAEPFLAFMGLVFVVVPGALPWLPALVASVLVARREERAAGRPLPSDHERRVRGWAWAQLLVPAALLITMLVLVVLMHGYWWFWGPIAAVVGALLLVAASLVRLVGRRDWVAADRRATMLTVMWLVAGGVGSLVLLAPLLLAAVPCRRLALHARALAWYEAQAAPAAPVPASVV